MHSMTCNSWQYYDYVTANPSVLAKGCDNILKRVQVSFSMTFMPADSERGSPGHAVPSLRRESRIRFIQALVRSHNLTLTRTMT